MMGHRHRLSGGEEWDAFSRKSRHFFLWKRGQLSRIKARFQRRIRKLERDGCREIKRGAEQ